MLNIFKDMEVGVSWWQLYLSWQCLIYKWHILLESQPLLWIYSANIFESDESNKNIRYIFKKYRRVTRNFLGQESLIELGHFDKQSSPTRKRKARQGKISDLFPCKLLKIALYMKNFTYRWPQPGNVFQKLGFFFPISEKGRGRLLPLPVPALVTRLKW